jgi:hypothetical protein
MCDPDYIEEPEERKCYHCGALEKDGARLAESYCEYGQGLLHCQDCRDYCDECKHSFCSKIIKKYDCGETYGEEHLCDNCAEELGLK